MTKNKKILIAGIGGLAVLIVALILIFSRGSGDDVAVSIDTETRSAGPVAVSTETAQVRQISKFIEGTGSFAADEKTNVSPKVAGQIVSTMTEVGDFVQRGQVIARLDDKDARLRLEEARASEQQAQAAVRQAAAKLGISPDGRFDVASVPEVQSAYQNYLALVQEAKLAAVNEARYANLLKTGDTSRVTYDQQRTQAETTNARAKASLKQYENAKNIARQSYQGIASAQAALRSAQTQVDIAQKAVADSVVTAPFSGSIDARPVSIGEYVTPSTTIATILRTSPIKLSLPLPEAEAGKIRPGMSISASVAAYPEQNFAGVVSAIKPALDVDSRSIVVEATFQNTEGKLQPGMFGAARILIPGSENGIFVPASAVMIDEATQSASLYVIEEGTARLRVVQVGESEGEFIRVLNGVAENETVATGNLNEVFDGAAVVR